VLYGYHDLKGSEAADVIIGTEAEAIAEIARMEQLDRSTVIGYRNGWPVKISNADQEGSEAVEESGREDENDNNIGD
jgi:hypothetical protein